MGKKRGGRRKVTREIADFIRDKHEEGYIYSEILDFLEEKYAVELHPTTITRYYKPWDEVIEKYKMISRIQKKGRYDKMYHRYYRHFDKYLSKLLSTSDSLSLDEISSGLKEITGIGFKPETVKKKIKLYLTQRKGPSLEEIKPKIYRIKR